MRRTRRRAASVRLAPALTAHHVAPRRAGSELLRQALEAATKLTDVKEVYLHVWTANEDARRFYERHGFVVAETLSNYYRGISPPDCFVLRKVLDRTA